jgi:hypothetical protein
VFDPAGKSAVDAAVEVASSDGLRYIDPGATDASGVARFRLPADAEIRGVLALKNGVGVGLYQNADASPVFHYKPMPAEVTISLQPARTVSVRAVGPEGEPLAGISIGWTLSLRGNNWVRPTGLLMESTTDAAGMARFSWFPRDGSGALRVVAPKDLLETLPLPLGPRADSADVTLTVPFERKVTVAGRVFHGDGSPARGVKVVAHSDGQPRSGQGAGRTSEDGSYKLSVRAGTLYAIGVVDPDWTAQPLMGITIRPGEQRQGLDLRLIPGTRLHGRVASPSEDSTDVYVRHLGPQLPPELQIPSIGRTRQSFLHWARIGAQGQYEARLAPGDYEILVVDRPREPETRHVDGTGELVIDFLQKPKPPVALSGLVVAGGPGGAERPVKAFITLTPVQGAAFRTTTDDTGRFRMMRPDRESALYAQSPDGVAAVKIGPAEKEVKVVLAPPATVTGRIVDVAGRPLAGEGPYLAMESGPGGLPAPHNAHALSKLEADGRYQFRLIPGAEYQLVYVSERETPRVHAHPIKKFRVNGAEQIDLGNFNVPDPPADLKKP